MNILNVCAMLPPWTVFWTCDLFWSTVKSAVSTGPLYSSPMLRRFSRIPRRDLKACDWTLNPLNKLLEPLLQKKYPHRQEDDAWGLVLDKTLSSEIPQTLFPSQAATTVSAKKSQSSPHLAQGSKHPSVPQSRSSSSLSSAAPPVDPVDASDGLDEETSKLYAVFRAFATSGALTRDNFSTLIQDCRVVGATLSAEQALTSFQEYSPSGRLDFSGFVSLVQLLARTKYPTLDPAVNAKLLTNMVYTAAGSSMAASRVVGAAEAAELAKSELSSQTPPPSVTNVHLPAAAPATAPGAGQHAPPSPTLSRASSGKAAMGKSGPQREIATENGGRGSGKSHDGPSAPKSITRESIRRMKSGESLHSPSMENLQSSPSVDDMSSLGPQKSSATVLSVEARREAKARRLGAEQQMAAAAAAQDADSIIAALQPRCDMTITRIPSADNPDDRHLNKMFTEFCLIDGTGGGISKKTRGRCAMDSARFKKFCRDTKLMGKNVSGTDVDLIFMGVKRPGNRRIGFSEFYSGLARLAARKFPEQSEAQAWTSMLERILKCAGPVMNHTTEFEKSEITDRMTDPTQYTGAHRHRFDIDGRGLGLEGRRDKSTTTLTLDTILRDANANAAAAMEKRVSVAQCLSQTFSPPITENSRVLSRLPKRSNDRDHQLEAVFRDFCFFGDRLKSMDGNAMMDGAKWAKLCRDSGLVCKPITPQTVDLVFASSKPRSVRKIDFRTFYQCLGKLACKKYPKDEEDVAFDRVVSQILETGGPAMNAVTAHDDGVGGIVGRLTVDPAQLVMPDGADISAEETVNAAMMRLASEAHVLNARGHTPDLTRPQDAKLFEAFARYLPATIDLAATRARSGSMVSVTADDLKDIPVDSVLPGTHFLRLCVDADIIDGTQFTRNDVNQCFLSASVRPQDTRGAGRVLTFDGFYKTLALIAEQKYSNLPAERAWDMLVAHVLQARPRVAAPSSPVLGATGAAVSPGAAGDDADKMSVGSRHEIRPIRSRSLSNLRKQPHSARLVEDAESTLHHIFLEIALRGAVQAAEDVDSLTIDSSRFSKFCQDFRLLGKGLNIQDVEAAVAQAVQECEGPVSPRSSRRLNFPAFMRAVHIIAEWKFPRDDPTRAYVRVVERVMTIRGGGGGGDVDTESMLSGRGYSPSARGCSPSRARSEYSFDATSLDPSTLARTTSPTPESVAAVRDQFGIDDFHSAPYQGHRRDRRLFAIFKAFSLFGKTEKQREMAGAVRMSGTQFAKFCRDCGALGEGVNAEVADLVFAQALARQRQQDKQRDVAGDARTLDFHAFFYALGLLARKRYRDAGEDEAWMQLTCRVLACGGPSLSEVTRVEESTLLSRLSPATVRPSPSDTSMGGISSDHTIQRGSRPSSPSKALKRINRSSTLDSALIDVYVSYTLFGADATAREDILDLVQAWKEDEPNILPLFPRMDGGKFAKLCRECGVIEPPVLPHDVDLIFSAVVAWQHEKSRQSTTTGLTRKQRMLTVHSFVEAIARLAVKKYPSLEADGAYERLAREIVLRGEEGPLVRSAAAQSEESSMPSVFQRMVDPALFTGTQSIKFAEGVKRPLSPTRSMTSLRSTSNPRLQAPRRRPSPERGWGEADGSRDGRDPTRSTSPRGVRPERSRSPRGENEMVWATMEDSSFHESEADAAANDHGTSAADSASEPVQREPETTWKLDLSNEKDACLRDAFLEFAGLDNVNDTMTLTEFLQLCKDCQLYSDAFNSAHAEEAFAAVCSSSRQCIDFPQFYALLRWMCALVVPELPESEAWEVILERIFAAGGPSS
eukprot:Rmarinus@m.12491